MGRVRTAAAKKYIQVEVSSDENESLANISRSSRSKKDASNKSQRSKNDTPSRSSRNTRNSVTNGKENDRNEKNGRIGSDYSSSEAELEVDAPAVNRKRKASNEAKSTKNQKPSTSATPSKNKSTPGRPKTTSPKKIKKNKAEEERYEVEEILDHKFEDNTKYFLIRWKGYDSSVDSWERQHNISCPALLAKYYEEVGLNKCACLQ